MSVRGHALKSSSVEKTVAKDISNWLNVGVTVDMTGVTATGNVEGSRGMGAITDVWEVIMAYGDAPKEIDNSFRRIRLNTSAYTSGEVTCEVSGN